MTRLIIQLTVAMHLSSYSQPALFQFTFSAMDQSTCITWDSIKVKNLTQGEDTLLLWPDSILSLGNVGVNISNVPQTEFEMLPAQPNPSSGTARIPLFLPSKGHVSLYLTDLLGRTVLTKTSFLEKGYHTIRFTAGSEKAYLLTTLWNDSYRSTKIIVSNPVFCGSASLEFVRTCSLRVKNTEQAEVFDFSPGDELLVIGYSGSVVSGFIDWPEESKQYVLQFAYGVPCEGLPTVTYDGQTYNTVQVFSQCWLKENLNAGEMIAGSQEMTDNGILEKYCCNDDEANCETFGGLYQWDEVMQYVSQEGARGICPEGWHIPADHELSVLEGAVDSQYGIGDEIWENLEYRGFDVADLLKSTSGWLGNGNGSDAYGFSALPASTCSNGYFYPTGYIAYFWSSTEEDLQNAWYRSMMNTEDQSYRFSYGKENGFSVRCLLDQ